MKHEIRGTVMQSVEITLSQGESVFTEAGGMSWMTENIEMKTEMKGGLLGALTRAVSGESLFMTDYIFMRLKKMIQKLLVMPL